MRSKELYVVPNLEEICDVLNEVLCASTDDQFISPGFGGMEDDFLF